MGLAMPTSGNFPLIEKAPNTTGNYIVTMNWASEIFDADELECIFEQLWAVSMGFAEKVKCFEKEGSLIQNAYKWSLNDPKPAITTRGTNTTIRPKKG